MSSADMALRLLRARAFLYSRQAYLYGARPVRFDLEKGYADFDAMLKRSVYYARFGVREVVAEARAEFGPDSALLRVHRPPGLTPAKGGASSCEDFLRSKRLIPAPGAPPKQVNLSGRIHEAVILPVGSDYLELRLILQGGSRRPGFRLSARSLRESWFQALLSEWIGSGSPLRLDRDPPSPARIPSAAWSVSRRLSLVDVDIGGEEDPHVFRWKETALAKSSTFADLDDADIAAALAASGTVLPPNAHEQGRLREDLGQGSACLLLRYAHLIPDPDPAADGTGFTVPPRLSPGFIVMENDYLEILIDAGTGKVFSEARKWRPEPSAAPALSGELVAADAG